MAQLARMESEQLVLKEQVQLARKEWEHLVLMEQGQLARMVRAQSVQKE
jgi:ABC-type arginine transport system ATPase subunit